MHSFFGRQDELSTLLKLTQKNTASMVVVTGRRRVGKSRLIEEFAHRAKGYRSIFLSGLAPTEGITAATQRQEFARQLERQLALPPIAANDWGDLFSHLALHTKRGRWVVLMDEISWMGSKDDSFLPKLKNAWDLELKKNRGIILVLCGSVSSWLDRNILGHTGFVGRISVRLRVEELPLKDCYEFWRGYSDTVSTYDKLKVLSVTGGVPRYLEEILPAQTADENIAQLCFRQEGLLFNEFEQIFSDLFEKRSGTYKKIVETLADGNRELKQIYDALTSTKSGVISGYLSDLELAGFVKRHHTWNLKTGLSGKRSRFRLSDNYVRFYLKHIAPNRAAVENGRFVERPLSTLPGFDTMMGLAFENTVLRNRTFIWERCGIYPANILQEGPLFQSPTRRRRGCQVDYAVQLKHGPLYLCEIKLKRGRIDTKVIDEVQEKVNRLEIPRYVSVLPVLVHLNGLSDAVRADEYFVKDVDFSAL